MRSRTSELRASIAPDNAAELGELVSSFNIQAGTEALKTRFDSDESSDDSSEEEEESEE